MAAPPFVDRSEGIGIGRDSRGAAPDPARGTSPPETPAPFPCTLDFMEQQRLVKGSLRRRFGAALDQSPLLRRVCYEEGKGASADVAVAGLPVVGRKLLPHCQPCGALRAHEALPHTSPGGKPPETPDSTARDRDRPRHFGALPRTPPGGTAP